MIRRATLATLLLALGLALAGTSSAAAANGDILFKQCVSASGSGGACTTGPIPGSSVWDVAVAPDGRTAYVSTWSFFAGSGGVAIFDRNPVTGTLSPRSGAANCYKVTPVSGDCTPVRGMTNPLDVLISPDGTHVYVAGWGSSAVAVFDRNTSTGQLTQKLGTAGCIGAAAGCTPGRALASVLNLFPSPDFKNIYATAQTGSGAIAILTVQPDGSLQQLPGIDGCVTENGNDGAGNACTDGTAISIGYQLTVSPDGKYVYGASRGQNAITLFNRDDATGGLTQKNGTAGCIASNGYPDAAMVNRCGVQANLNFVQSTRITPDGRFVYALGNSIVVFERASNGLLTFRSCVTETAVAGCTDVRGVTGVETATISPDGRTLVARSSGNFMSFFDINPATGALTQRAGAAGCASADGSSPSGAATCRTVPLMGGEGNVEFANNLSLTYGGFSSSVAMVFDRDFGPTCQDTTLGVPYQTSILATLTCSDPNGDPMNLAVASQPLNGSLGGGGAIDTSNNTVRYNPPLGFTGSDSFTYTATARGITSAPALVTLNVAGPPPVVVAQNPPPQNPPPPPPGKITITLGFAFSASSNKQTKFTSLTVKGFPSGSTITVRCIKGSCPSTLVSKKKKGKKTRTVAKPLVFKNARGTVKLSKVIKKALKAGTRIRVDVTKAGMIGATKILEVRKRKAPKVTTQCLPVGSTRPQRTC